MSRALAAVEPEALAYLARKHVRIIAQRNAQPDPWLGVPPEQGGARDKQRPPPGNWRVWMLMAGRAFGKTRAGAEWVRLQAAAGVPEIGLIGATSADVRDIMIEGPSGVLAVCERAGVRPTYESSKRKLTFPNGVVAHTRSADEPDRIRGLNLGAAWADELGAWRFPEAWTNLDLALRYAADPRVVVTTTPKPVQLIRDLVAQPDTVLTRGATRENAANLAPSFLTAVERRYKGTRTERQELGGELLEDIEGALWSLDLLDRTRWRTDAYTGDPMPPLPPFTRIVVAIDPQTGYDPEGDSETGIVVAGRDANEHGYVLADLSGNYLPHEWAGKAVDAYRTWQADRIVAEANQGGKMVESTIKTVSRTVPITLVHASRGKLARAEPVSALYQQGKVHHVGSFPKLEEQLTTYVADSAAKSPDRLDACVWAMTDLLLGANVFGIW